MKIFLFLFGLAGLGCGILIFFVSQSAIHEIEALVAILIGVVGFGTSEIASEIDKLRRVVDAPDEKRTAR